MVFKIVFIVSLVVLLFYFIEIVIIKYNPDNLYNRIFERKDTKLWKSFIENYDKFVYDGEVCGMDIYVWKDEFNNPRYYACLLSDNSCIILSNDGTNVILSDWNRCNSHKMANLLKSN